jgi:DNA primase
MAFPPSFLDELRQRVSLSQLIGRRVRLTRRGREHSGLCPFHNEKSPSFTVSDDKGFFHCFGCGAHGDAIGFVMRAESLSFPEAVERLAGEAGVEVPRASPEEAQRYKAQAGLRDVTEAACQWFQSRLRAPEGRAALDYLRRRGLGDDTIQRFRLGYAPESGEAIKRALTAKTVTEEQMIQAGLVKKPEDGRPSFGFFRDRVMFPIADRAGRVVAFGARTLGDGQPKYLNSPDTPLFDKGRTLYAFSLARVSAADRREIVVCEGYMDVIALHQAGIVTAVAPLGTALTESQLEMLWRVADEPILCFDADAAGQRAAARAALRALPMVGPGRSVRFAELVAGKDPDDLIREKGVQAMRQVLDQAQPLVEAIWRMETAGRPVDTPERRAALRRSLEQRAQSIAERGVQEAYRLEFRNRLDVLFGEGRFGARAAPARQAAGFQRRPWTPGRPFGQMPSHMLPGYGDTARRTPLDAADRRWRILLAALINHPHLLDELDERLAALHPPGVALDKLLQELHIARPREGALDSAQLRSHLTEKGFAEVLGGLLAEEVYALARGAGPSGSDEEARALCLDALAHLESESVDIEIEALRARAEADPSEQNLTQLVNARKRRLDEMAARAAQEDAQEDAQENEGTTAGNAGGVPGAA